MSQARADFGGIYWLAWNAVTVTSGATMRHAMFALWIDSASRFLTHRDQVVEGCRCNLRNIGGWCASFLNACHSFLLSSDLNCIR